MDWRQRRDNTNVGLLLELATELGVDAQRCLANTGLQDQSLEQVVTLELWQELAVIRNLVAQYPYPGAGLKLGQRYHLTSLGLLGYTMLASRTLMEAIEITSQFRPLALSICPISLESDKAGLWMALDDQVLPEDARPGKVSTPNYCSAPSCLWRLSCGCSRSGPPSCMPAILAARLICMPVVMRCSLPGMTCTAYCPWPMP